MSGVNRLPLRGAWQVWAEVALRSAGFPAATAEALSDPELGRLADVDFAGADFLNGYAAAVERQSLRLGEVAADPRFREAVAWQNPPLLHRYLDKLAAGGQSGRTRRRREATVASYLQRYALKNDTIGFFGPFGWARWSDSPDALRVDHGGQLVARRSVQLEQWAVEEFGRALWRTDWLAAHRRPRRSDAAHVADGVARRALGRPVDLDPVEAHVLELCDGTRTAAEVADLVGPGAGTALDRLLALDLVTPGDRLPHREAPEYALRDALAQVGDAAARRRALDELDRLVSARDAVATAAGDAEKLLAALDRLDQVFVEVTAAEATRRSGEVYAGRRLVYQDTVRDVRVELGRPLLDALAAPLSLVLDSARWFVGQAAGAYRQRFLEVYEACQARLGTDAVPLSAFASAVTPDLAASSHEPPPLLAGVAHELRRRWAAILAAPPGARRHAVSASAIAGAVRECFPTTARAWSSAVHHCPDIMIAAAGPEAVRRGEFTLVLGELHVAMNTLDSRCWLAQHPDPQRLVEADVRDRAGFRIVAVPATDSAVVNSRTYPPAMLRPEYVFWTLYTDHTGAPGPVRPAAGLTVERAGDRLLVRDPGGPDRTERGYDVLDVFGEQLSAAVMNGFSLAAVTGHRPRIIIDRLVVAREAWRFPAATLGWPAIRDPASRYRAALAWRAAEGVPLRAFYKVATEPKPIFVDFSSIALVDLLATTVRRAADEPGAMVAATEMLPDVGDLWLRDADGAAYTCELRLVTVDTHHQPAPRNTRRRDRDHHA